VSSEKRPPPSPLRAQAGKRPPPLPGKALAVSPGSPPHDGAGDASGPGVSGLMAVGVLAGVLLALVATSITLWAISRGLSAPVAVAPAPQPSVEPEPSTAPKQSSPLQKSARPHQENPDPPPAPSPKPSRPYDPKPMPAGPEPPMAAAPNDSATTSETRADPVLPRSVEPTPAPAATIMGALDDVRQRGNVLPLPPTKETAAVLLCMLEVAKPAECELTLFGLDGLLPGGASGTLACSDPTPDERIWTVTLKPSGNLTKERPVADFGLKDKQLTFRWRAGASIPLEYCLLRIDAPGEQELCHLSRPLEAPAAAFKVQTDYQVTFKLPAGAANLAGCKLELLPQNFPPHMIEGDSVLESGKKATLQVTGTASGTIEPTVDLEVAFTLSGGEATIKVASLAEHPPIGPKDAVGDRKGVSAKQLTVTKERLDRDVNKFAARVRNAEKLVNEYTLAEMRFMQGFQQQQLILVRMKLAQAETELEVAKALHDRQSTALTWHDDMLALVQLLESQAALGFRLVRPIGQDQVEIALTVP
jgi:hypothetical protein